MCGELLPTVVTSFDLKRGLFSELSRIRNKNMASPYNIGLSLDCYLLHMSVSSSTASCVCLTKLGHSTTLNIKSSNLVSCFPQDLIADYSCSCLPSWEGKNCDRETDDCIDNQCRNGATCVVSNY